MIIKSKRNMFYTVMVILVLIVLGLAVGSQLLVCVENQVLIQITLAITFIYYGCMINRFVKEILPIGFVTRSSIKSTRLLFYVLSFGILIRSLVMTLLVIDSK